MSNMSNKNTFFYLSLMWFSAFSNTCYVEPIIIPLGIRGAAENNGMSDAEPYHGEGEILSPIFYYLVCERRERKKELNFSWFQR